MVRCGERSHVPKADNSAYLTLPWLSHPAQVGRSISNRSESFAYHFAPCMAPISFNCGVSTSPRRCRLQTDPRYERERFDQRLLLGLDRMKLNSKTDTQKPQGL